MRKSGGKKMGWNVFRKSLEYHNKKPRLYPDKMEINKRLLNSNIISEA